MSDGFEVEEITREEAELKIKEWGEALEVDTERAFFGDVIEELSKVVMKGRLSFDEEREVFSYRLIKPIQHQNSAREIIEIKEASMEQNKVIDRIKGDQGIAQAEALMQRRTNLTLGEVSKLSDRDVSKINAVIMGFFVQTKSSR